MGKILMALRYGSLKTKFTLIAIALLLVGGGALLIYGISGRSLVPMGIGALLMIIGLLIMMTLSFTENGKKNPDDDDESSDNSLTGKTTDGKYTGIPAGKDGLQQNSSGPERQEKRNAVKTASGTVGPEKKDAVKKVSISGIETMIKEPGSGAQEGVPIARENAGYVPEWQNDMLVTEIVEKGGIEELIDNEIKRTAEDTEGADKALDDIMKKAERVAVRDERNFVRGEEDFADDRDDDRSLAAGHTAYEVPKPTRKQLQERKKLLKVKGGNKKYIPIFVDEAKRFDAYKRPAYVQLKGKNVSIILIENMLRTVTMPLDSFTRVTYAKNVEERNPEGYEELKADSEVYQIFEELLPGLYSASTGLGSNAQYKNQYILGGTMAVSSRSMRKLMKRFDFDFHVFDSLDIRGSYSDYFKMAYENRIFWTDNCISQTEYQDRTRSLLQMMVDDDELLQYDFSNELNLMVKYKLITREYADYYLARKGDKIKIKM